MEGGRTAGSHRPLGRARWVGGGKSVRDRARGDRDMDMGQTDRDLSLGTRTIRAESFNSLIVRFITVFMEIFECTLFTKWTVHLAHKKQFTENGKEQSTFEVK